MNADDVMEWILLLPMVFFSSLMGTVVLTEIGFL